MYIQICVYRYEGRPLYLNKNLYQVKMYNVYINVMYI
uniref:Uncharacterized protein n=1 Tax=Anguilla anguilla TaxID=7936 RepID=A0A0E9XW88_ANGAN